MVIIFLMRDGQAAGGWCSEAEVRQIIGAAGAATLIDIISGGWQAYLDEGQVRRRRRTRAGIVWERMIECADRDLLTGFDGVRKVDCPTRLGMCSGNGSCFVSRSTTGRCGPPTCRQSCSGSSPARDTWKACRIWPCDLRLRAGQGGGWH